MTNTRTKINTNNMENQHSKLMYDSFQRKCNKVISECEEHDLDSTIIVEKLIEMLKKEVEIHYEN